MSNDLKQDMFAYLDDLREIGAVNMMGAGRYLEDSFGIGPREARDVLLEWIQSKGSP